MDKSQDVQWFTRNCVNVSSIVDKKDVKPYDKWPATSVSADPLDFERIANDPSSVNDWLDSMAANPFSKPVLIIKSSSFYFNITRSAYFENVVFDGIDAFGSESFEPSRQCIVGTEEGAGKFIKLQKQGQSILDFV